MWIYDYTTPEDNPFRQEPFVQIRHLAYVNNLPNWKYPWHEHADSYEIGILISGSGFIYTGDAPHPISTGSVTVIPPGTEHRYVAAEGGAMEYYTLRFLEDHSDKSLLRFFRELGIATADASNYMDYLTSTFQMLMTLHQSTHGIMDSTMQTMCLSFLYWLRTLYTHRALTLRFDEKYGIGDILSYIEQNISQRITLEQLSHQFGISTTQLNRLFRRTCDTTPINYLIHCRVTYATEYLLKTDLSVTEISQRVGYENPNHFINMFVKKIGCTPDDYRKANSQIPI